MLKEDRVFPEEMNYTVVIGALGRKGYVNKAFQLYIQMRKRAISPSEATYTGLFNAVAQSSNSSNLKKAINLYAKIHQSNIRISRITYNAIIKAFGKHGTTEQMLGIFRESIMAGFEPDSETFNMILLCLQRDKEAGFRHAIEVWRMMLMLNIKPDGKSIMYLLKVLKHCGIGSPDLAYRKLVTELPDPAEYKDFFKNNLRRVYWLKGQAATKKQLPGIDAPSSPEILTIDAGIIEEKLSEAIPKIKTNLQSEISNEIIEDDKVSLSYKPISDIVIDATISTVSDSSKRQMNLLLLPFQNDLQPAPNNNIPVSIARCDRPWLRLQLIGGHKHVFEIMKEHEIKPTVMLLSTLIQVLESNREAEDEVIEFAEQNNVKLDADFFNLIIRKRAGRFDMNGTKLILSKMVAKEFAPNYRTWCTMALTCVKGHYGVALINEAKNANVEFDHIFFNSLISTALKNTRGTRITGYEDVKGYDYRYLSRIIYEMKQSNVKADHQTIELLEKASEWPEGYNRWKSADPDFEHKVFNFRKQYKEWLNHMEIATDEEPVLS
uniref:pentatricopeptide repeat-containing protein 1, mitochondrial-like n=1 Tax=Styela clava TaxID=7725 RepID=UPI00193951E5|nr:pentatricopeptide repeat-containing protein 1, mitochondrial-like [Styela clava]